MKSLTDSSSLITERLTGQAAGQKFPTCYVLTGEETEKKKKIAVDFAKSLNCQKKKWSESCDCESCRKVDSGNHPDVRWYGLDEEERSIKIETVRDLQNWLHLRPYEGKVKVFILNDAGRLTTEAQNALLKSLEEPPANSVLILLAEKRSELLDTVISRLVHIKVPPYQERELVQVLSKEGMDPNEAQFLARFSSGNLKYARSLSGTGFKRKNEIIKILVNDPVSGFDRLNLKSKKEATECLTFLAAFVRDACALYSEANQNLLVHEDRLKDLQAFLCSKPIESLFELYDDLEETRQAIENNINQKLALARLQVIWNEFLG